MGAEIVLLTWLVLGIGLLLPPLLGREVEPLGDASVQRSERENAQSDSWAEKRMTAGRRELADDGFQCRKCGAHIDGAYLYCGECLTPQF